MRHRHERLHAALIYTRTASRHPDDHHAAEQQLAICQTYAQQHDLTVEQEFIDLGASGTTTERLALRQLLDYIANHQVGYVLCTDTSRIARDRTTFQTIVKQIEQTGARLLLVTETPTDNQNVHRAPLRYAASRAKPSRSSWPGTSQHSGMSPAQYDRSADAPVPRSIDSIRVTAADNGVADDPAHLLELGILQILRMEMLRHGSQRNH